LKRTRSLNFSCTELFVRIAVKRGKMESPTLGSTPLPLARR
jgi:hypothetical protein